MDNYDRFDVRERPLSIARVYADQTLFDEPTRAVMNVNIEPAALIISKLIPADEGNVSDRIDTNINIFCQMKMITLNWLINE